MSRRVATPMTAALIALPLLVPAQASAAKTFAGETRQHRPITLRVADDGLVDMLRVTWLTRRCERRRTYLRDVTEFSGPFDETTPDAFTDSGSYTLPQRNRVRIRITLTVSGERRFDPAQPAAESWTGTLRGRAVIRRRGRVVDRCRLAAIGWTASLA